MRYTRGFGVGISNYAYWTFEDTRFGPLYFFLLRVFARLEMRCTRDFGVGISNYPYWTFLGC